VVQKNEDITIKEPSSMTSSTNDGNQRETEVKEPAGTGVW